jgi:hypothetical protein
MRKRKKFHIYFFVTALLLQCIALIKKFLDPETALSFTVYNANFTLDKFWLLEIATIVYFSLGLGYWLMYKLKRMPNPTLAGIHTIITVGGMAFYLIIVPVTGIIEDEEGHHGFYTLNETLLMLLIPPFILAQLLNILNIFIGIQTPYRRHRHKKKDY